MRKFIIIIMSVILTAVVFQSCSQDDWKIRQDVETILEEKYPAVFVSVDRGVVTLTGIVDSTSISKRAEEDVLAVKNVKKVNNKIEIYNEGEISPQNP